MSSETRTHDTDSDKMEQVVEHDFTTVGEAPWDGWKVRLRMRAFFRHTPGVASLTGAQLLNAELIHEDELEGDSE